MRGYEVMSRMREARWQEEAENREVRMECAMRKESPHLQAGRRWEWREAWGVLLPA